MKVRTLFISDLHLGSRACQAPRLLEFLNSCDADTIYLIGDIIDGWRLQSRWYWPHSHHAVLEHLVARARAGTPIVYVSGNHDQFVSETDLIQRLGFSLRRECEHVTADGNRYLIVHGDQFDVADHRARWLYRLGSRAYETTVRISNRVNRVRTHFGLPYRPYASGAKRRVKSVMGFIGEFEQSLESEGKRRGNRGVICGHIHHAALRDEAGFCYMNTGDWVESCSAIVEHRDGRFELLHWGAERVAKSRKASRRARQRFPLLRRALTTLASHLGASVIVCARLVFASLRRIRAIR